MTDQGNLIVVTQGETIAAAEDGAAMANREDMHIKMAAEEDIIIINQLIGLADHIKEDTEDRIRATKVIMEVTLVTEKTKN